MDKENLVTRLKDFKKQVGQVQRRCHAVSGRQIQSTALLQEIEAIAALWFDEIEPALRSSEAIADAMISTYRDQFGSLLELADGKPSKAAIVAGLDNIDKGFHAQVLVPIRKHRSVLAKYPTLASILSHSVGLEKDFLEEAVDCARLDKRRAAVILGWCAAVDRLHRFVEKEGFGRFNQATVQMSALQSGRYKRFNKKFEIQNLSDLRMSVFDSDLLWVLEFLGYIDGNEHERLEICFTVRNTSAHPGDATLSEENILSFFSDIDKFVLSNPRFALN